MTNFDSPLGNELATLHSLAFVLPNGLSLDTSAPDPKNARGESPEIWCGSPPEKAI